MTGLIGGLVIGAVVLVVAVKWLFETKSTAGPEEPEIDYEELSRAEEEIQGLDGSVKPDDADEHLSDWGPGAPRHG